MMVYLQIQAGTLSVCLHFSRDLYRPPQAALCYTLLLCTEGLWERVTSCSTTAGLYMCVSTDVYAHTCTEWAQLVHVGLAGLYGLTGCCVCM